MTTSKKIIMVSKTEWKHQAFDMIMFTAVRTNMNKPGITAQPVVVPERRGLW